MIENLDLAFWKARKDGKGAGATFQLNNGNVWLAMLPQQGDKKFDSGSKVSCKLGQADIGELLAVLRNRRPGVGQWDEANKKFKGIFHSFGDNGNYTALHFYRNENNNGYSLGLAYKRDGNVSKIGVSIFDTEAELLEVFLVNCLPALFTNDFQPKPAAKPAKTTIQSAPSHDEEEAVTADDIPF